MPDSNKVFRYVIIENSITLAATAGIVLGLYAMSDSWHSLWGLLLLLNLNSIRTRKE